MSPYEILIVVFTVIAIIVGILIEYIKKRPPPLPKAAVINLIQLR